MGKIVALVAIIAGTLWPSVATACHRVAPTPEALDQYQSVFLGNVTAIHLKGYENGLLGKPDLVDPELGAITITDGSGSVDLRVAVTHPIRGKATGAIALALAGCTYNLPKLKGRGIFFVLPGGETATVAWESDTATYDLWLSRLGVARDGR
jgi:hypothetical protein